MGMGRYDKDIEENRYLSESGKYAAQFARNHGIGLTEAFKHPAVQAYKDFCRHSEPAGRI